MTIRIKTEKDAIDFNTALAKQVIFRDVTSLVAEATMAVAVARFLDQDPVTAVSFSLGASTVKIASTHLFNLLPEWVSDWRPRPRARTAPESEAPGPKFTGAKKLLSTWGAPAFAGVIHCVAMQTGSLFAGYATGVSLKTTEKLANFGIWAISTLAGEELRKELYPEVILGSHVIKYVNNPNALTPNDQ